LLDKDKETGRRAVASSDPSLGDVDAWFDKKVLPQRTASAGFSLNRIYKSPAGLFKGNEADANGLCGDAASYVLEAYGKAYPKTYTTSDGYLLGVVLWEGLVLNHIANVMLPKDSAFKQGFEKKAGAPVPLTSSGPKAKLLGYASLIKLRVYDLYYKTRTTLGPWWDDRDEGGRITVGLESDFT